MKSPRGTDRLGRRGEELACAHLKGLGYQILARNFNCPIGELDLIALDGETLVFAEVKTLRHGEDTHPAESVHARKQAHLRRTARYFISMKRAEQMPARFDVLAVTMPEADEPRIEHIQDAF